ncbi:MAG: hypothetical protein BWZ08_00889 [candidate division BRC1 bacterium ADurb.BinA292]|nr:MAG: hypothetical protein BWZ08_00889 [candidate division BRC1 bacterium ADurb.BinA292]
MHADPSSLRLFPPCHGVLADLQRCGWRPADQPSAPRLEFRTYQGVHEAQCAEVENPAGRRLLLIGLESVVLARDEDLFPRFLNLAIETRMALAYGVAASRADWLLLLTRDRIDLYRLPEETALQQATAAGDYDEGLLPELAALARTEVDALRLGSQHLRGADSLRGWIRHWALQLAYAVQLPPDQVEPVLWRWILMLQWVRRTERSEANGSWGLYCRAEGDRWAVGYDAQTAFADLTNALSRFDELFHSEMFRCDLELLLGRLNQIEETTLLDRLRAELLMHSQDRFEPETVAWLFTDLAREQEGWRREVSGVEPLRRRLHHQGWTIYRPLACDVERHGLTFALRETERLAHYLNNQMVYARQPESPSPATAQPDLFKPEIRGVGPTGHLDDPVNYLFEEALRLRGVEAESRFGVGLVFLLKALALGQEFDWPFFGVDTLDALFREAG